VVNIGEFDRIITIQRAVESTDSIGTVTQSWVDIGAVYASVIPMTGTEVFRSGMTSAAEVARFRLWFVSGLTPKDRISYDGKIWNIKYLREIGRRCLHEVLAEAAL